jgi:hypothetical protein
MDPQQEPTEIARSCWGSILNLGRDFHPSVILAGQEI